MRKNHVYFFNDTATTEIYTLSLHDALPISARDAEERFQPAAMIVGASCTGELIQDDPGGLNEQIGRAHV